MTDSFASIGNLGRLEAKRSLNKLGTYLKVKGILLRRKIAPSADAFQEGSVDTEFMHQFVGSTDIGNYRFWNSLSSQSKSEAFKYMSLRDNVPHRVVSTGTKKKADIFIVISGSGTEKNCKSGETRVVGKGSVLGAVDMFENYNNPDYLEPEEPVTYISTLKKGCLVRLRLCDFIMSQYGPKVDKEAEYLASLPAEEQLIYSTRKFATKAISPGLFSILDANDLLPTDPSDNSFKYLCTGNINRRLELRRGDLPSVFIIMKGSVTVALMRHMRSILALKDEDDSNSIVVKVNGTPLITVEEGTLLCIDDSCFQPPALLHTSSSKHDPISDNAAPPVTGSSNGELNRNPLLSRTFSQSSLLSAVETESSLLKPYADFPLFHLDLVFKSTCTYVRIPKRELKEALKLEDYATTSEIVRQLSIVSHSILSRISELDIWNSANISIKSDPKEPLPGSTWGVHQREDIKVSNSEPNIIRGLQGTYVLPGSFDDSTIREEGEDNASDRDILYPQAPLLAKKIRPSETFRNTELLEDADV